MPRHLLLTFGAGLLSAVVFSLFLAGSPIAIVISPFTMLPLLMVGLGFGAGMTTVAGVGATIVIGAMGLIGAMGSVAWAVIYAATEAIPAIAISRQALVKRRGSTAQWTSSGHLMGIATGYACLLFIALVIAFAGQDGGLRGILESQIAEGLVALFGAAPNTDARQEIAQLAHSAAHLMPGAIAAWWLIIAMANLGIAQTVLMRLKRNRRPSLNLRMLDVPRWIRYVLGAAILLAILGPGEMSFVGWTLAVILAVPYFFVGLMVIHALCRNWRPGPFFLAGFYLLLIFRGWPMLIAAALGFVEQWVKLRHRIGGPTPR